MTKHNTDFSISEMEKQKRELEQANNTAVPGNFSYNNSPSMSMPGYRQDSPASAGVMTSSYSNNEESLNLQRMVRVMHRHLWHILLLILILPAMALLIDLEFRDYIYSAAVSMEMPPATENKVFSLGLMEIREFGVDTRDLATVLRRPGFDKALQQILTAKVKHLQKNQGKDKHKQLSGVKSSAESLSLLAAMSGNKESARINYRKYRGVIGVRAIGEKIVTIEVRGKYPAVHRQIADLIPAALNQVLQCQRLQAIEDFNKRMHLLLERMENDYAEVFAKVSAINEHIKGKNRNIGTLYSEVSQLQAEEHKSRIQLMKLELKLKARREEFDWQQLKERYGIGVTRDILKVLVKGNPLREKLRRLQEQRDDLFNRYTEEHPQMQALGQEIKSTRELLRRKGGATTLNIVPALPGEREEIALQELYNLFQEVELVREEAKQISQKVKEETVRSSLAVAQEGSVRKRRAIRSLLKERNALTEKIEMQKTDTNTVYRAMSQVRMLVDQVKTEKLYLRLGHSSSVLESPQVAVDVIFSLAVAVVLALALAFLQESIDHRLHTPFDVYYYLHLNCLGVIPYESKEKSIIINFEKPGSQIAEVFAHLRNNIRYGNEREPQKCLQVVSATQGEGKSTISANLGISYALEGNNVLLVDSDMRRPTSHKAVEILNADESSQYGLSDYLTMETDFAKVVHNTVVPGLSLVPAGSKVKNPTKLLASPRMQELLVEAEKYFDMVIVDCPAVLPVADSTMISSFMRGVVVVVEAEEIEVPEVKLVLHRLEHVGAPLIGAILNKTREDHTSYYYGNRYRTGYYSYDVT